jgi:hypothetical protein
MDIDENIPMFFIKKIINITFPYMYEIFILWNINLVFYNIIKIPIKFIIMEMFQHFCDMFVAYYIIAISNFH